MLDSVMRPAGGSVPIWTPALTVQRGGHVVSPADAEIYRRVAATGTSGTDPADDLTNYVAASYERITAFPPPLFFHTNNASDRLKGGTRAAGFSVPQGTRVLAVNVVARGELSHLSMQVVSSASTNSGARIEIVVDGKTLYNADVYGTNGNYINIFGGVLPRWNAMGDNQNDYLAMEAAKPIQFRRSLQIYFTPTWTNWSAYNGLTYILRGVA